MTTSFPGGLDAFTNPTSGDTLASPDHAAQHADVNDAVEALQAKVGVDGSAVTSSLDYKISNDPLMRELDTQTFTSSTTYTMPAGAKIVVVECISSGGGGNGGAKNSSNAAGGGGGAGGPYNRVTLTAAEIGASATVTIGAGGSGGAGATVTGNGGLGSQGGTSRFGPHYFVGGKGSYTSSGGTGYEQDSISSHTYNSLKPQFGQGGAGASSVGGAKGYRGGGGGGGGGLTIPFAPAYDPGRDGGESLDDPTNLFSTTNPDQYEWIAVRGGGGAGGATGGGAGGNGTNRAGGGGGGPDVSGNGGAGGNGATPGGGGGGGGPSNNANGGAGGNGGNAQIKIWVYG